MDPSGINSCLVLSLAMQSSKGICQALQGHAGTGVVMDTKQNFQKTNPSPLQYLHWLFRTQGFAPIAQDELHQSGFWTSGQVMESELLAMSL